MKKVLFSLFIYLFTTQLIAQPISNRANSMITVQDARLMAKYNLFTPRYADTTTANLATNIGIDSCGAVIYTYDENALWYRQCSPKMWVLLSNGNAPVYTADRGVQILSDNTIRLVDTVEGAATKLQWLYDKAAFRAGNVTGTQWDISNIGLYSFATGINTIASGSSSAAIGLSSQATGINAIALGGGAIANGNYSLAMGNSVTASGNYAIALGGYSTTASGIVSMATGNFTKAVGNSSFSGGVGTYMNTLNGVVFGAYNDTTSWYSNNPSTQVSTDPVFVIGNGASIASRSNAFTLLRSGALQLSSGITATTDTSTYKPMVMDADGNVRKTDTWAVGVSNLYNIDDTLTGDRIVTGDSHDLTITGLTTLYLNAQDSAVYQGTIATDDNSRQLATTEWVTNRFRRNLSTNTTQVGNVGAGTDDLMVDTIPANTLANDGDYIEFYMNFFFGLNANSKEIILYFGTTDFHTTGAQNQNDGSILLKGTIIRTSSTTQTIIIEQIGSNGSLYTTLSDYAGGSEDLTTNLAIKAAAIGVSDDDIVQNLMIVKYTPANN